jgi:hypothetical protein
VKNKNTAKLSNSSVHPEGPLLSKNIVKPNRINPMMAKKLDLKCPQGLKLELYHLKCIIPVMLSTVDSTNFTDVKNG